MKNYFEQYKKQILWEEPIQEFNLTLYPVLMENVFNFFEDIGILLLNPYDIEDSNLSSLPYLELLFILGTKNQIFHTKLFNLLSLILNIKYKPYDKIKNTSPNIYFFKDDKNKLKLRIIKNDNSIIEISSLAFNNLKNLILIQNGIEIEDLMINPQIYKNAKELQERQNINSEKYDFMLTVYSVASQKGYELCDIKKWSIFRFNKIVEAIDTNKKYTIYATAEVGGFVTFKNGNPISTWILSNKKKNLYMQDINSAKNNLGINIKK